MAHGDDTNHEGAIKAAYTTKEKRYVCTVRDPQVEVDALVMNSGGRICGNFDALLSSLATMQVNNELGPAVAGEDTEEKSELNQHNARMKRALCAAVQVTRTMCQVSMIWAACPSTNNKRVSGRW